MKNSTAFTLIELLVVITIIVVLLALLTPALDRAIYQAELAMCAASFDGLVSGSQMYAVANSRRYPKQNPARGTARQLKQGAIEMRPLISEYIDLNGAFNDPLMTSVDYETVPDDSWAWAGRDWFAGYGFGGQAQMDRLGQRFTYNVLDYDSGQRATHRFSVLAADDLWWWESQVVWQASHPDSDGFMSEVALQARGTRPEWEGGNSTESQAGAAISASATLTGGEANAATPLTIVTWITGQPRRGTLDLNFGHEDGSVSRVIEVEEHDRRLKRIPIGRAGGMYPDAALRVPPN